MSQSAPRRSLKHAVVASLGILTLGTAVFTAVPASASSGIEVYVSYADSLRADATNFPTPWYGSPQTVFEGCRPVAACTYDGGAIRVVNNSGHPVSVDAIAVHVSTCTFTGWSPTTLTSGQDLIVTQMESGAASGCTGPVPTTMDTSDIGPMGMGYSGVCVLDGIQPTVDVTIDGVMHSYTDSGQVLNTGGKDAACDGNESIQWTVIGTGPCRGSSLTLAPTFQQHRVLSTASVTATFTNSCGQPLSDVAVDFAILAGGPNAGATGSGPGVTDAKGQALFSYSSSTPGVDTLQASITNLAGQITSNVVSVKWTINYAAGGAFVISDKEYAAGGTVYWWGAQWWKKDPLKSGLRVPAAFKGYETSNAIPWCGQTWSTRPGNSPHPPATVSGTIAVIVASHVVQKGPVISGDIVHIVLVQTKPGYGPNPGHPGTGTIVGTVC